jgi:Domain of unknown function (DUF4386)
MTSIRKTALVAGVLYLVTFLSSIPAAFLLEPLLTNPNYITSGGADAQVSLAAVLDLVTALAGIGTAVAVFSIVKRQHEGLALGFVTTRMLEAAVLAFGAVTIVSVVTLRQAGAAGGDAGSLVPVGRALVAMRDWTAVIGPGMASLNALMFGTLLYRARLVPRGIPLLGIVGAPLFIAFVIGTMLGVTGPGTAFHAIAVAPFFFWELFVGIWMTFRGFNPSAPILTAAAKDPARSARTGPGITAQSAIPNGGLA